VVHSMMSQNVLEWRGLDLNGTELNAPLQPMVAHVLLL